MLMRISATTEKNTIDSFFFHAIIVYVHGCLYLQAEIKVVTFEPHLIWIMPT